MRTGVVIVHFQSRYEEDDGLEMRMIKKSGRIGGSGNTAVGCEFGS
mgnify:CR=1 FL=1